jgi:hypothetical protein
VGKVLGDRRYGEYMIGRGVESIKQRVAGGGLKILKTEPLRRRDGSVMLANKSLGRRLEASDSITEPHQTASQMPPV